MPELIPKGLTREHVFKALAVLDAGTDHGQTYIDLQQLSTIKEISAPATLLTTVFTTVQCRNGNPKTPWIED